MKTKYVKNEFPVLCDFCGDVIHAGEECVVEFDEQEGTAQFKHKVCPGAFAVVTEKPKPPPPLFWALRIASQDKEINICGLVFAAC